MQPNRHSAGFVLLALFATSLFVASCAPPPVCNTPTSTPLAATQAAPNTVPLSPRSNTPVATVTPVSVAGEVHWGMRENIKTLNPFLASNNSEVFAVSLLYDTLLQPRAGTDPQPGLAERWLMSPDGQSLTFWLNPRAQWHDGQPVTARDVVFTFDLLRRVAFPESAHLVALVDRVEAVSTLEAKFTLLRKDADTLRWLGTQVPIVPAHVWERIQDPLGNLNLEHPVGSGPFSLQELVADKQLVLRNTRLHPTSQPRIEQLVLEIVRDETKALQMLKDGKLDALGWDVAPSVVDALQKDPQSASGVQWLEAPGIRTCTLLLNLRKPPYNELDFRLALAQALNVPALISTTLLSFADVATPALVPPGMPWRDESITALLFDSEQANQKLDAAGFLDQNGDGIREGPDGTELLVPLTCPNSPLSVKVAESIAASWKATGVLAEVVPVAQEAFLPALMQAQFDVALYSLDFAEPEMAFFALHSSRGALNGSVTGLNYGGYSDDTYDEWATLSREEPDESKRRILLQELQTILAADLPQIPLYVPRVLNLYREDHFTGWTVQPGSGLLNRETVAGLRAR